MVFFSSRRRHTRYWRDWSSDVCSSDLVAADQTVIRIKDADEARRLVEEGGHANVKVGVADIDGVLRGKYLSKDKFFSALEKGFGFCDVIVGWDSNDQLYDNVSYTGWHTAYPDAPVRLLPETGRILPFERSEEHTSELQSRQYLVCRLLLEKKQI